MQQLDQQGWWVFGHTTEAQTSGTSTSPQPAGYVAQTNRLCAELTPKVLEIHGGAGHHVSYSIKQFEAEKPKLAALFKAFDAQVDALPVADSERDAARAFQAFRAQSDRAAQLLDAAAATGRQRDFDAAFTRVTRMIETSKTTTDLDDAGIICPAR